MSIPNLNLKRNLRKSLLQGQPWIYRDNLALPKDLNKTTLCKVKDMKNEFLGWGIFSPQNPLAVRMLSFDKNPPNVTYYELLLQKAKQLRQSIVDDQTNTYRLINGEGDLLPGLICDIYGSVAVIQFDGQNMYEFWDQDWLASWLLKNTECKSVYFKPRHDSSLKSKSWGDPIEGPYVEAKENGCAFLVDIYEGQKTGFFLDQRENRNYVKKISPNKTVLNLFSYTGGFSVYAGMNGAKSVTSVDIAQGALDLSQKIWALNQIKAPHKTLSVDVFDYLAENQSEKFDIVICDPPSLAKSESQKELAMNKYVDTFAAAAKLVNKGGHLILSSCSSHISFNDFEVIVNECLSKARKRGLTLRFSGQGPDHPYPQACPHLRYLKFIDLVLV